MSCDTVLPTLLHVAQPAHNLGAFEMLIRDMLGQVLRLHRIFHGGDSSSLPAFREKASDKSIGVRADVVAILEVLVNFTTGATDLNPAVVPFATEGGSWSMNWNGFQQFGVDA